MHEIRLDEVLFHGGVSYEWTDGGVKPWRLPHGEISLYADPLVTQASMPAGVRIGFISSTRNVRLSVKPFDRARKVDCVVDDELFATGVIPVNEESVSFSGLPEGEKRIELYLPQDAPVIVTGLAIDSTATRALLPDDRPRWITYGSSITQAKDAASPAQTWPALVARSQKFALTCLGYSGQCHMDSMVARLIRDLPADFISLCLGINVMGGASLNMRTFRSAAIGMIRIIREKHPDIPLAVISPICSPSRETQKNAVGLDLVTMREELQEAVARLAALGDDRIIYVDGLQILGPDDVEFLPDGLHPNADGYRLMADNFVRHVLSRVEVSRRDRSLRYLIK